MNQTYLGGVRGRELRQCSLPREVAEIPADNRVFCVRTSFLILPEQGGP